MTDITVKSNKIRIGDISISYRIKKAEKDGEKTIIFLHGFPFNKNMWNYQLEFLDDNITGIAVDIRGHGNSTSGHGFLSIDVFAKDLLVFIKKMELKSVILCGISMGGYIALRAYEIEPEGISGLILCDTNSFADNNEAKQKRFDSIQAILRHGRRPFAIGFIEKVFTRKSIEENTEAIELIKSSIRRNDIPTICSTLLALAARTDTSHILKSINIPTLLIRGMEDQITTAESMTFMKENIKNCTYKEFEGCGHLPNMENPLRFNQEINNFAKKTIPFS